MYAPIDVLRASVDRLHDLADGLDDGQLTSPSYCAEWSIAQVLSHVGSGAVIARRNLEDTRSGTDTPSHFNQSVWDEWDAKTPGAQRDEALAVDRALMDALEAVPDDQRAKLTFPMGPLSLGFDQLVSLRLNEHAFHTWDIAVVLDGAAGLPDDATSVVVDNLSLIAHFSGRSGGQERTITVRTTNPGRELAVRLAGDGVELSTGEAAPSPDLELPAEAFCRLVYGRLDPDHTPHVSGDPAVLATLRAVFPGP